MILWWIYYAVFRKKVRRLFWGQRIVGAAVFFKPRSRVRAKMIVHWKQAIKRVAEKNSDVNVWFSFFCLKNYLVPCATPSPMSQVRIAVPAEVHFAVNPFDAAIVRSRKHRSTVFASCFVRRHKNELIGTKNRKPREEVGFRRNTMLSLRLCALSAPILASGLKRRSIDP